MMKDVKPAEVSQELTDEQLEMLLNCMVGAH